MRRIRFEARDIWGNDIGKREIEIGAGVGSTFANEINN